MLPSHRCSLHDFSIRIFPAESNQVSVALSPLQVKPHDSRRLRAIELSVPNVIATFQVKHRNADGVITDARVYNIDLNAGKVFVYFIVIYGAARHVTAQCEALLWR